MSEGLIINPGFFVYYATITVTYPSGSTLTCTCGSDSFTAETTSGSYTFVVPYAGTWTVRAVKGSESDSKAVSITTYNQAANVTLQYDLILYNNGTVSSLLGNITTFAAATKNANNIQFTRDYGNGSGFTHSTALNLSAYSTLCFEGTCTYPDAATGTSLAFGITKSSDKISSGLNTEFTKFIASVIPYVGHGNVSFAIPSGSTSVCIGACRIGTYTLTKIYAKK